MYRLRNILVTLRNSCTRFSIVLNIEMSWMNIVIKITKVTLFTLDSRGLDKSIFLIIIIFTTSRKLHQNYNNMLPYNSFHSKFFTLMYFCYIYYIFLLCMYIFDIKQYFRFIQVSYYNFLNWKVTLPKNTRNENRNA